MRQYGASPQKARCHDFAKRAGRRAGAVTRLSSRRDQRPPRRSDAQLRPRGQCPRAIRLRAHRAPAQTRPYQKGEKPTRRHSRRPDRFGTLPGQPVSTAPDVADAEPATGSSGSRPATTLPAALPRSSPAKPRTRGHDARQFQRAGYTLETNGPAKTECSATKISRRLQVR